MKRSQMAAVIRSAVVAVAHEEKDAEISRLKADLARVRGQRDDLACAYHRIMDASSPFTGDESIGAHGLRILDQDGVRTVEEIEK